MTAPPSKATQEYQDEPASQAFSCFFSWQLSKTHFNRQNPAFPDLINHDPDIAGHAYVLSDEALADVPESLRT